MRRRAVDQEQQAKSSLGRSNEYAFARTELAKEQMARIKQIRLEAAAALLQFDDVRRFVVNIASAQNMRVRNFEKRVRAKHPGLPAEVYSTINQEANEMLELMSEDALNKELMRK